MGTDQHIFTEIWNRADESFRSHIRLLPPDAINTKRPATLNHEPYNQVIHMVGSVPAHRIAVFRSAFATICNHLQNNQHSILPRQLGITRERLQDIEKDILESRGDLIGELTILIQGANKTHEALNKDSLLQVTSLVIDKFQEDITCLVIFLFVVPL